MTRRVLRIIVAALWFALPGFAAQSLAAQSLAAQSLADEPVTEIVVLGDSIAAGFGLPLEEGLVAQLQNALDDEGVAAQLKNGGVSGDTTAGGLARVDWTLGPESDVVILILGGNDALRGLTPSQSEANLDRLIASIKARGLKVLLTGMRAPPNLGADYAAEFEPMYERLAAKHEVMLYPFILEGVAADRRLNQDDGIHPNADGVKVIVKGLVPTLLALLAHSPAAVPSGQ